MFKLSIKKNIRSGSTFGPTLIIEKLNTQILVRNSKLFSKSYFVGPLGYPVRTVALPPEVPAIDNPLVVGAIAALIIPLGALFTWFLLGN